MKSGLHVIAGFGVLFAITIILSFLFIYFAYHDILTALGWGGYQMMTLNAYIQHLVVLLFFVTLTCIAVYLHLEAKPHHVLVALLTGVTFIVLLFTVMHGLKDFLSFWNVFPTEYINDGSVYLKNILLLIILVFVIWLGGPATRKAMIKKLG